MSRAGRTGGGMSIASIDPAAIHRHIYVLTEDEFCAYEYQDGSMPDLSDVRTDFLAEFVKYLVANNLNTYSRPSNPHRRHGTLHVGVGP